jgi:hypothetical protein
MTTFKPGGIANARSRPDGGERQDGRGQRARGNGLSPQVAQKLPVLPAWACPLSHRASRRPGMRLVDGAGNAGWPMSQLAAADTPSDPKRRYFAVLHNDPYDVVA